MTPIIPIYCEAMSEVKEQVVQRLGHTGVIRLMSARALQPSIMYITSLLVCILGDCSKS